MSAYEPARAAVAAAARDLSDDECAELEELLAQTPRPFEPMGVVMLDGYLCGVLVQPEAVDAEQWLPYVFDLDGRLLPTEIQEAPWHRRAVALMQRRCNALNRMLLEDGAFDPLIGEADDEEQGGEDGEAVAAPEVAAVSRPFVDWAAGFHFAAGIFPALEELDDDAVPLALARIYRHLPAESDDARELLAALDADAPLRGVDEAADDLVAAVADLFDLTRELRFQVETVRRDAPKVGRNDPCPCGSGKKYKRCHGAAP